MPAAFSALGGNRLLHSKALHRESGRSSFFGWVKQESYRVVHLGGFCSKEKRIANLCSRLRFSGFYGIGSGIWLPMYGGHRTTKHSVESSSYYKRNWPTPSRPDLERFFLTVICSLYIQVDVTAHYYSGSISLPRLSLIGKGWSF